MSTVAHISCDEYERMVDAGVFDPRDRRRLEFIRGEIREMSPISPLHADMVDRVADWSFASTGRDKVRVRIQSPIRLPGVESVPEPDVVWALQRDYSRRHPGPDDVLLLIEVAESSLQYDLGEKADLYAAAGIRDYWVVDLVARRVVVHRDPADGRYRTLEAFSGEDAVRPLAFPEITLRPAAL
jgi:Uma2 family endonuclease